MTPGIDINDIDEKKGNFFDRIEGDKVVWIIVLSLMLISLLAIFSSTSLLALETGTDRLALMKEQIGLTLGGLAIIFLIYKMPYINVIRALSQLGFIGSLLPLLVLAFKADLGFIKAECINGAYRTINLFGFQFHVFEVVKVAMIVYLAWAIDSYRREANGEASPTNFWILNRLGRNKNLSFLKLPFWKCIFYIYLPMLSIAALTAMGSNSSGIIVAGAMFVSLLIGGLHYKHLIIIAFSVMILGVSAYWLYNVTDGKMFTRVGTGINRILLDTDPTQLHTLSEDEFQEKLDRIRQPNAAMIAVHEGGFFGKGPGGSTQKYAVPVIFGDYMFSFLLEEYGIWLGLIVILLYASVIARGAWIVKMCETTYARTTIGGLCFLIAAQAFLHMFISVDFGPLTGQTLPLVSHGAFSFLAFCVAFGLILNISRLANKQIQEAEKEYEKDIQEEDDVKVSMNVLDQID